MTDKHLSLCENSKEILFDTLHDARLVNENGVLY